MDTIACKQTSFINSILYQNNKAINLCPKNNSVYIYHQEKKRQNDEKRKTPSHLQHNDILVVHHSSGIVILVGPDLPGYGVAISLPHPCVDLGSQYQDPGAHLHQEQRGLYILLREGGGGGGGREEER